MVEKLKRWLHRLWHHVETLFRIQRASQPIHTWRFWFGVITTTAAVLSIELGRRMGVVVPIPFLILFGSVVLAANVAGLLTGLISAAIATAFITYAAFIPFGPGTLTGGPWQVVLGALIHFAGAFFLGRTKSLNSFLIEQLQTHSKSLEELVEAQTSELREANQSLRLEVIEHKQTLEALQESEARYRAIVESQTEFVSRKTSDGRLTFVNDAYCRQFGKTREELLGTNITGFLVEEDRHALHEKDLSLTPENPIITSEHREYRPDGSIAWYHWTSRGIFDEKGQLIEMQAVGRDVTRRKQAEEALRESEARYRAIVEIQTEFVARTTPDGRLTFVNDAYCRQFGQTREQLLGTKYIGFLVEEDRQAVREMVLSLTSENPVATEEHREYRPDGSIAWYQWTRRGIFDEQGQLIEVQSVGQDITERKEAEEALRESEARFQRLAEAAFEGIAITDQGTVIDVNDQVGKMLRWEPTELIGKSAIEFVAPESRELVQKNMMSGYEGSYEHMAVRKDGSTFPVEVRAKAFPYKGRMLRVTAMRDITQRKEAEEALRRSEERFSRAFHLNPSAIAITTLEEGCYLDVNQTFLKIHRYRREEVVGHTSAELNLWVEAADRARIVQALREDGQVRNQEVLFRVKSGEVRVALTSLEIIELDQEPHILSMFLDITERKQLEEQLRQTQKMEAIGQLTAGIAHDFNNLLLVINGFAELMHLELTPDDPHQESLAKILHSGKRASDLVNQLLTFSRKQVIEPRLLDLNTTVVEMNKMMRRIIGEKIELETKLEPDLWLVKIDPSQIEQIIINLAINARDAMPDGGRLTIETSKIILDDNYVAQHLESQPGEHVLLAVNDTGHGMSEEIKSRIFDPFFTTKEQHKGTGLGLATVYGIIRQNGGNIWVNSEEGVGTTFKIYLPREIEPTSLLIPYSEAVVKTVTGTETILIVEDDPAVRHLIGEVLVGQGYTLLEAQDGSEALQLAAQYKSTIHLLLTDVIMPGMNGPVLAKKLSQLRADLRVLFMSGYADSTVRDQNVLNPNTNLLQKPFSPIALTRKVREVLDD